MLLAARSAPLRRPLDECTGAAAPTTKAGEQGPPREPAAEEPNTRDEVAPAALVEEARTRELLPPWPPSTAAAELSTRSTIVADVAEPGNNHRPGTADLWVSIKLCRTGVWYVTTVGPVSQFEFVGVVLGFGPASRPLGSSMGMFVANQNRGCYSCSTSRDLPGTNTATD